jgi:hypothetical protein
MSLVGFVLVLWSGGILVLFTFGAEGQRVRFVWVPVSVAGELVAGGGWWDLAQSGEWGCRWGFMAAATRGLVKLLEISASLASCVVAIGLVRA